MGFDPRTLASLFSSESDLSRRNLLGTLAAAGVTAGMAATASEAAAKHSSAEDASAVEELASTDLQDTPAQELPKDPIDLEVLKAAGLVAGVDFTDQHRKAILGSVRNSRKELNGMRSTSIPNEVYPAMLFQPAGKQPGSSKEARAITAKIKDLKVPESDDDLAFLTVNELGHLIRTKQLKPSDLLERTINRIKKYAPALRCVITLLEDQARAEAQKADREIARNYYRGPLHGIPYGIKDLFAVKGAPTTWGAEPYRNQVIDTDAEVVVRLREAGAILVAKTSVGALAYGDVWFGGLTRNPWNPKQGASGSSAGSASGVAAGLFPFAIGTETLGSIVSPSQRCRVTGLRPTFGRISRYGAMALSWSMDKVGPIARTAEDCAIVFAVLCGADPKDPTAVDRPFNYRSIPDLSKLKVGILGADPLDEDDVPNDLLPAIAALRTAGVKVKAIQLSPPPAGVDTVLTVEAAAAFDTLTRSGDVDLMKGSLWPPIFRAAMFTTGVDYVQALRRRTELMEKFEREFADFDLILAPERAGTALITTNLTGHPQLYMPMGLNKEGKPFGCSIIGRLYEEDQVLGAAHLIQQAINAHRLRPEMTEVLKETP